MRGDLSVEADGELGGDERQPGRHVLGKRLDELSRLRRAIVDGDMDARSLQRRDAAASGRGVGVERGYVHAAHAGIDEGLGAGRRAPPVGARLERDIEVGALGGGARLPERHNLGVGLPGGLRGALAEDASVLHEHRADRWVRVRAAHRGARQLDRSTHVRHFGHATPPSSSRRRRGPRRSPIGLTRRLNQGPGILHLDPAAREAAYIVGCDYRGSRLSRMSSRRRWR